MPIELMSGRQSEPFRIRLRSAGFPGAASPTAPRSMPDSAISQSPPSESESPAGLNPAATALAMRILFAVPASAPAI